MSAFAFIALPFALLSAGSNMDAKIAIIAMTTNSSISVNAGDRRPERVDNGTVFGIIEKIYVFLMTL